MKDLDEAFDEALKRHDRSGFNLLSETDKILTAIWGLEADVNNGGFDQYYFNSHGDYALFAPDALRAIGAQQMALIVSKANAIFGPAGPPRSRNERQNRLAGLSDDAAWDALDREFWAYPDDLTMLLLAYIARCEKTD